MGVSKVWTCDLCGQPKAREELMRLGVRALDARPEDADNVDVGTCCLFSPVGEVLAFAATARQAVANG